MGAPAHQSAANTRREVAAAFACCPTAARLAVFGELCLEDLLVLAAVHEVANIAPKILGEREAGRGRNKLFVWVSAQIPRRKPAGREFAFAVARRDQEHQPVDFVAGNTLELLGDLVMDRACLVARVGVLSEAYQACRRRSSLALAADCLLQSEQRGRIVSMQVLRQVAHWSCLRKRTRS